MQNDNIIEDDIKLLNNTVRIIQMDSHINISKLEIKSIYIAGYADAGFANNKDLSSQLGFIVMLNDRYDNAAICRKMS